MKVVILAGGLGTRISEESIFKPKPMIEIGSNPILWHIMKSYSHYGFNEFIICSGYKSHIIKEYFSNYYLHRCDITFDFTSKNRIVINADNLEPWKVTVVDTGLNTQTGGRLKRIKEHLADERFFMTYGDGVCNVNIPKLLDFHIASGKLATLTAVLPGGRFGALEISEDNRILSFAEKHKEDGGWVNGGFMVLEPGVLEYIEGDQTTLEKEPFARLTAEGQLSAYRHDDFWQCMDTMRDKMLLEDLLTSGKAPWVNW